MVPHCPLILEYFEESIAATIARYPLILPWRREAEEAVSQVLISTIQLQECLSNVIHRMFLGTPTSLAAPR